MPLKLVCPMPRRAALISQADVARAVRALKRNAVGRVRLILEPGKVTVEEMPSDQSSPARPGEARRRIEL
jgi:hypothetical protein